MTLKVLDAAIELVREAKPVVDALERVDADLARQLWRATKSVPAQIGEAEYARKGNGAAKLQGALAEAREAKVHLRVAVAAGYLPMRDVGAVLALVDSVCARLYTLVWRQRPRRA